MRKPAAIALCLAGVGALAVPAALLVWTYRRFALALSDRLTPILTVSLVIGVACLASGLRGLRGPRTP